MPASFLDDDTVDFPDELDTSFFTRVSREHIAVQQHNQAQAHNSTAAQPGSSLMTSLRISEVISIMEVNGKSLQAVMGDIHFLGPLTCTCITNKCYQKAGANISKTNTLA